jgi:Na+-transporting NADH:ubiquinone oxidoreductase subunit NqrB
LRYYCTTAVRFHGGCIHLKISAEEKNLQGNESDEKQTKKKGMTEVFLENISHEAGVFCTVVILITELFIKTPASAEWSLTLQLQQNGRVALFKLYFFLAGSTET